ncbi:uncharacterized protein LOC131038168 isoform X2 [Cryptomeria japonica]|uniref:uncharacterized protein LOC131038168 isoform X2 n=1 Tax=Cryptomeria japonica TaxID=3369 RepID=UPI0027DA3459|nr:uncharacterized protein LOC131038168 isoform X2 [Cryptomeria japonica]
MNKVGGRAAGIDPVFSSISVDHSQSVTVKWLEAMHSSAFLPPETQSHAFNRTLLLRHLTVDHVEPGLVISTLKVKPSIANVYDTLHGGAVAMIASIMGLAAVKTVAGDKEFVQTEINISCLSAARIGKPMYFKFRGKHQLVRVTGI